MAQETIIYGTDGIFHPDYLRCQRCKSIQTAARVIDMITYYSDYHECTVDYWHLSVVCSDCGREFEVFEKNGGEEMP